MISSFFSLLDIPISICDAFTTHVLNMVIKIVGDPSQGKHIVSILIVSSILA